MPQRLYISRTGISDLKLPGDTSRDLQLEDGKGIISHVNEYTYLGVRISKDGNHEPEINDRINRGRAAITKLTAFCGTVM